MSVTSVLVTYFHQCLDNGEIQGRIQDFNLGGAQTIMCPHAHYERWTELTFGKGPVPAYGPWKLLGCFNALSCYLSLIFKHSD